MAGMQGGMVTLSLLSLLLLSMVASSSSSSSSSSASSLSSAFSLSSSSSGSSGAGVFSVVSSFSFSDTRDGLSCLSSSANAQLGFASSDGGDIFSFSLSPLPAIVAPAFVAGSGQAAADFITCEADPAGSTLYLLDTRFSLLYAYTAATPAVAPVVVASFPDEVAGACQSLAVDWHAQVAYIGTRSSDLLYSVNLTQPGVAYPSVYATSVSADITCLALSSDGTTLYYGTPVPAVGQPGLIQSLQVDAGVISSAAPVTIATSMTLYWPDSLLLAEDESLLYVKDGGPLHGLAEPGEDLQAYETLWAAPLNGSSAGQLASLFSTNTFNLPPGLALSANRDMLFFVTTTTLDAYVIIAVPPPTAASSSSASYTSSPSVSSSSSSFSSSAAAAASSTSTFASSASASLSSSSSLAPSSMSAFVSSASSASTSAASFLTSLLSSSLPSIASSGSALSLSSSSSGAQSSVPALLATSSFSSSTSPPSGGGGGGSSLSHGAIAGIVIGGVVGAGVLLGICCMLAIRCRRQRESASEYKSSVSSPRSPRYGETSISEMAISNY